MKKEKLFTPASESGKNETRQEEFPADREADDFVIHYEKANRFLVTTCNATTTTTEFKVDMGEVVSGLKQSDTSKVIKDTGKSGALLREVHRSRCTDRKKMT